MNRYAGFIQASAIVAIVVVLLAGGYVALMRQSQERSATAPSVSFNQSPESDSATSTELNPSPVKQAETSLALAQKPEAPSVTTEQSVAESSASHPATNKVASSSSVSTTPVVAVTAKPTIASDIRPKKVAFAQDEGWEFYVSGEEFRVEAITLSASGLELRNRIETEGLKVLREGTNLYDGGINVDVRLARCPDLVAKFRQDHSVPFPYPCPGSEITSAEQLASEALEVGYISYANDQATAWDP